MREETERKEKEEKQRRFEEAKLKKKQEELRKQVHSPFQSENAKASTSTCIERRIAKQWRILRVIVQISR